MLSRHVRVHCGARRETEQMIPPLSEPTPQFSSNHDDAILTSLHSPKSANVLAPLLPPSANQLDSPPQEPGASSLLWPDSEDFFQNIMSLDALTSDQFMLTGHPAVTFATEMPQTRSQRLAGSSSYDECSHTEDGHRAVQTVNGLITDTVSLIINAV